MHFFDTYAIFETMRGNKSYEKYKEEVITTTILNLGELYYGLLIKQGKKIADSWLKEFKFDFLPLDARIVVKASYFRFLNKKKKFSYVDCIGYILALEHKIPFLTGDKAFKGLPNVEFVK